VVEITSKYDIEPCKKEISDNLLRHVLCLINVTGPFSTIDPLRSTCQDSLEADSTLNLLRIFPVQLHTSLLRM
jgi:hypothetical protein